MNITSRMRKGTPRRSKVEYSTTRRAVRRGLERAWAMDRISPKKQPGIIVWYSTATVSTERKIAEGKGYGRSIITYLPRYNVLVTW